MEDTVFEYSAIKNLKLIQERNVSFEEIIAAINKDKILAVLENANQEKYRDQKVYIVHAKEHVYMVPFLKKKNGNILLITIIPSRKAKQKFLGEKR